MRNENAPADWQEWLIAIFPLYVRAPFAPRHAEFWEWVETVTPGVRPAPFVAIWPRGGAKSSSVELACVRLGAKKVRRYAWYVCETQEQADKHVETIAALLESKTLEAYYPDLANRMIGKYGNSKGWRRSRLRTVSGLTIDAIGLDSAARGAKVEDQRPDLMVMDDIDAKHDSLAATRKKIETMTTSLLPAGSNDCAMLFVQNLIHSNSVAAQLADGRADFLADRVISGPFPAIEALTYEQRDGRFYITGGVPTWGGQNLQTCQEQIWSWGLTSFLKEAQHDTDESGGIWDHIEFQHVEWSQLPEMVRGCVWVDPAVTSTDDSDSMGIQADGIAENDKIYRFYSWEDVTSPEDAMRRAIFKALELGFERVGVETDQGGDTWETVYTHVCNSIRSEKEIAWKEAHPGGEKMPELVFPAFASDKAGSGYGSKAERNMRMLADYERGQIMHVLGTHTALERSLKRFPKKPLDLADAAFWGWNDLRHSWYFSWTEQDNATNP